MYGKQWLAWSILSCVVILAAKGHLIGQGSGIKASPWCTGHQPDGGTGSSSAPG